MEIEVSKLEHHPLNREIYSLSDIDDLVGSISDVGLLQLLVIDQHNQVISGNRRLCAIRKLGWKKVEVEKVKVLKKDIPNLLIHYNKQRIKNSREILNEYHLLEKLYHIGSGRRTDLLTSVIPNTGGTRTRDIVSGKLGVSSSRLAQLLFVEKEHPSFIDLIDEGKLTTSQAYQLASKEKQDKLSRQPSRGRKKKSPDNYTFYRKSSNNMIEIDDEIVQLVFTSPPYWNKRTYSDSKKSLGGEKSPDQYVDNLVKHFSDTYRVVSTKGSFFLNLGDSYIDGNLLNIPHKVVIALQDKGWILKNTIIWKKKNPKPSSAKRMLNPSYDFIFHLVKSKNYYYQLTPTKTKSPGAFNPSINNRNRDGSRQKHASPVLTLHGKNMGDYWDEDVVSTAVANTHTNGKYSKKNHPAPFVEEIVVLPLLQTTKENDIVLDPFHGSGTTGRVATQFGRRYIGYDIKTYR